MKLRPTAAVSTTTDGISRQGFLRGIGLTLLAGTAAVLMPAEASAAARPARSAARGTEDELCYSNCTPVNCGNTGCDQNAHVFYCDGCIDRTFCIPNRTCNSFCYQTQPC
jgi:hypothetical protein